MKHISVCLALLVFITLPHVAKSLTANYRFEGYFDYQNVTGDQTGIPNIASGIILNSTVVSGRISYETDQSLSDSHASDYFYRDGPASIFIDLPAGTYSATSSANQSVVTTVRDGLGAYSGDTDGFSIRGSDVVTSEGLHLRQLTFSLSHNTHTAHTNTIPSNLSLTSVVAAQFSIELAQMEPNGVNPFTGDELFKRGPYHYLAGRITSLERIPDVPIPASLSLLGFGLLVIGGSAARRRRRLQ